MSQDSLSNDATPTLALSLTQPWATLVVTGAKRVETRSWPTRHRGPIGIHASKGFPRWAMELCFEEPFVSALKAAGIKKPADLPRGALIGTANLTDCFPLNGIEVTQLDVRELAFGDYGPGRWGFRLVDPVQHEPEPLKGALSFWSIERARAGKPVHHGVLA